MANRDNLIPGNRRSQSEAKENGRKGGIASGASRRERKRMKELLELALEAEIENSKGEKATRKEVSAIQVASRMARGDLKAIELGLKILGETKEQVDLTITRPPRDLTVEEAAQLRKELEREY